MENEELIKKAIAWWEGKRPEWFTLEDHINNPTINCNRSVTEAHLAIEVAILAWRLKGEDNE